MNLKAPCKPMGEGESGLRAALGLKNRQTDVKDRTTTRRTLNSDRTVVCLCHPSRDRQTQSDAAKFARPRFVGAVEPIKNVGQIFCRNSDSGVSKFRHGEVVASVERNEDRSARWRVLHSIVDQDQKKAMQSMNIALHDQRGVRDIVLEPDLFRCRQNPAVAACFSEAVRYINWHVQERLDAGIGTSQQHELLDERRGFLQFLQDLALRLAIL